jgi:hypothetical protein
MSLETINEKGEEIVLREVTSVMTLRSLKVLSVLLASVIARAERELGPIDLPQSKMDELTGKADSST